MTRVVPVAEDDVLFDLPGERGKEAFGRLFDEYGLSLHRYLARRVGAVHAEDLVGETFMAAWSSRTSYDPEKGGPRTWLFGIATNVCRRHHREEMRVMEAVQRASPSVMSVDGPDEVVAARVDAQVRVRELARRLASLTAEDRDVLLLTAWAGLKAVEVAVALGIPPGTVRSRLHRARRVLRSAEVGRTDMVETRGDGNDD